MRVRGGGAVSRISRNDVPQAGQFSTPTGAEAPHSGHCFSTGLALAEKMFAGAAGIVVVWGVRACFADG